MKAIGMHTDVARKLSDVAGEIANLKYEMGGHLVSLDMSLTTSTGHKISFDGLGNITIEDAE